jgi:polysaccharide export outer membrane protein
MSGLTALFFFTCVFALDFPDFKSATVSKMMSGVPFDEQQRSFESQTDNSIDPEKYFIGGADVFMISLVEIPSVRYIGTVNENCDVHIPELGIIKIGKTTLSQAKKIIGDFVGSKLKKQGEVYISLIKTKPAVVTVSGAVINPGTCKLTGTSRLLDAIKMANDNILPSITEFNFREVECRNKDTVRYFDLFGFLFKNNLSQNPYLYPGDNISLSYAKNRVLLMGAIKNPISGMVPIKQNETAADFLSFFTLDPSADSTHIIIQRTNNDNSSLNKIISLNQSDPFALKDRDVVIVSEKENYPLALTVFVKGEVVRPGTYPMVKNRSTAQEALQQAGGVTNLGNEKRAFVIRHKKIMAEQLMQNTGSFKPAVASGLNDNSVRPEINSGYSRMNIANDFSVIRLDEFSNGVVLEEKDEIVVPKKEYCIYLSGSVSRPGAYNYIEGKGRAYYIAQAGGFSSKADRTNVFVVTYYGAIAQVKENGALEEGDIIVVPDSQQYKFLSTVFIPILSAIVTIIYTSLAIYNIRK